MRELIASRVDWIHLDVMDGQFVPPITFGADLAARLAKMGDVPVEAHLMTLTPEAHFDAFIAAGCRRIIFHAEATAHSHRLCQSLHERGIQAGVAINPGTSVESLNPVLDIIDLALVMTVNPGWGGQKLIPACLEKVAELRRRRPELDIEVDGGIDLTTLTPARTAGANVFVTGSFLAKAESVSSGVQQLRAACAS